MRRRILSLGLGGCVVVGVAALVATTLPRQGGVLFGSEPNELVPDVAYRSIDGRAGRLHDLLEDGALVVAVRDVFCPVAGRYAPELGRLEDAYRDRGARFLYLNMNEADSRDAIRDEIVRNGFDGPYVAGVGSDIAGVLRPGVSSEVFVIDSAGTLRYRGAIDDQYGIDFSKPAPRATPLRDALDALLQGEEVPVARTNAEGCFLPEPAEADLSHSRPLTYHNRISRIVQENCAACHREEGVAPFSLESHASVKARRRMIGHMTGTGRMPPWFAHGGEWANDRSLSARDLRDLSAWIAADAPEGDPDDAPLPRMFAGGWTIGEPDAVIEIPEPFEVPATGVVDYQYMYVKTDFGEDKWISAMEILPTAPQVTHHVLVLIEPPDAKPANEAQPGEPVRRGGIDGFFAVTVPGYPAAAFPAGLAKKLPAGAWLKFQLHYNPNGREAIDRSRIGFKFADEPPRREIRTDSVFDAEFVIPPGAKRYEVAAQHTFKEAGTLLTLFPHTHVRGRAFRYTLVQPDGTEEILLDVPRYDFNWQLKYEFARPRVIQPGATLRAMAWYDNSADNPANPDPAAEVRFGEQTFEEMMIGYFDWVAGDPAPETTLREPPTETPVVGHHHH
jgi:mono/diheme cytochrome c family protein